MIKYVKKIVAALSAVIFVCGLAYAADSSKNTKKQADIKMSMEKDKKDEQEIKSLYLQMCRSMIAKDLKSLEEIHGDDFVLVHMTGSRMNKAEYIQAIKDGTLNYYSAEHDEILVQINGDSAVLRGKSRINAAVYGGGRHTWPLQADMKLAKRKGKWVFVFSQASTYTLKK